MTRKLSTYAAKMRRQPHTQGFNGGEWLNAIQRCRPFNEDPPIGSNLAGTQVVATEALLHVRQALDSLLAHQVAQDDTDPHDLLAHAIGIATIRSVQIAGGQEPNAGTAITKPAHEALKSVRARWDAKHQWGLTGPEREALANVVDLYETILTSSSPAQMNKAAQIRWKALLAQGMKPPATAKKIAGAAP